MHTVVMPLLELPSAVLADQCKRLGAWTVGEGPAPCTAAELEAAAIGSGSRVVASQVRQ
eukprot:SAG22_NODE_575_length_8991_cov_12.134859_14_plen_59_part_00